MARRRAFKNLLMPYWLPYIIISTHPNGISGCNNVCVSHMNDTPTIRNDTISLKEFQLADGVVVFIV